MSDTLLTESARDRLTRACRTAVGDSLRSVTYFDRTDYTQVYLREDLERDADLMSFIGHEWHDFTTAQDSYAESELGEYHYTIRVFENGFLVSVGTDEAGAFVTTEGLTMQDFDALAEAVVSLLEQWGIDRDES